MIEFSEIQNSYFFLPLVGFVIGIFGTILGGGGGFFFIPLLTLWLGVPAQTAVMTSLVATLPISLVGSWGHYRKKNVDLKIAAIFIAGGLIGAFAGAEITGWITEKQLKVAFGIYSILIGLGILLKTRKNQKPEDLCEKPEEDSKCSRIARGSFYGFAAGMITGTFGTSGTMPVIAGLYSLRIPLKILLGTSLVVVLFNTIFAISAHFFIGKIDLTLVTFLTAGSAIGALAGPKILSQLKINKKTETSAAYWYSLVMIIIGVLMIMGSR